MKKSDWVKPTFVKSAQWAKDYPTLKNDRGELIPEIAVLGRSNVGKSSLLNHLLNAKNLIRTSSTPGKTQLINFITLERKICFVDLPGYGFAKVPENVRKEWGPMIQEYLNRRSQLNLLLFLFDVRRLPNEEDLQLMEWIVHTQKAMILVLTKTDKLTKNELASQTKKIMESFPVSNLHYVTYSVPKNVGKEELRHMIQEALSPN